MGTPVDSVADLFQYQYVSLHVLLTDQTKESINKALLSKMPKGGTLINTARQEVVHEGELLEEIKALVGDKYMKRVIFTKKKMGAQTIEANNNAGVAAANQIVGFFEKGDVRFQVKA